MAKFDESMRKRILKGMILPCMIILLIMGLIVWRACDLMFGPEGDGWRAVLKKESVKDSSIVKPQRGNIYSCDGVLIASSVEKHKLVMDFLVEGFDQALFNAKIDSLCICVAKLYGNAHTPEYYKRKAIEARKEK